MTPRETEGVRAISLRFRAGDDVCGGLAEIVEVEGAHGAVVVSAVGSLSEVSYVLATLGEDGRTAYTDELRVEGAIELLGLQGHFGGPSAARSCTTCTGPSDWKMGRSSEATCLVPACW